MKQKLRAVLSLALCLAIAVSLAGCGKDKKEDTKKPGNQQTAVQPSATPMPSATPSPSPSPTPVPITVKIQKDGADTETLEAMTGDVFQLSAMASDGSVGGEWTSSNNDAASVDANGVVTCLKGGSVKITYTLGKATATCTVTVVEPKVKILFGGAVKSDITLNSLWGFQIQLTAQVSPEGAVCEWSVDDPTVLSVTDTGLVTALKAGTGTVFCTCGTAKASCVFRITENPPQAAAPATKNPIATPDPNDKTPRVVITFWGEPSTDFTVCVGATVDMDYVLYNIPGNPGVTWSIEKPEFATVDANGVVTGVKETTGQVTYTKLICTCGDVRGEAVVRVARG